MRALPLSPVGVEPAGYLGQPSGISGATAGAARPATRQEAAWRRPSRRTRNGPGDAAASCSIGLVVLLLVLAGLLVVADRVGGRRRRAGHRRPGKQEVAKQDAQSAAPKVQVGGFPFLTQVLDGRYERISIELTDVQGPVRGDTVGLPRLDVDARNVRASLDTLRSGQGDVVAETRRRHAAPSPTTAWPSCSTGPASPSASRTASSPSPPRSTSSAASSPSLGTADVTVADKGKVALRFNDLDAEGLPNLPLARTLLTNYAKGISIDVPLPELPFQLDVREVRPLPEGLAVTADARNVPINSAG